MLKIVGSIIFLALYLFSNSVEAILSQVAIIKGDSVTLTIKAKGSDVEFPNINSIAGYSITSTSTMQNISIINGKITKTYNKIYEFYPTKSVKIPPFEIKIDSKIYKTKELFLKVLPPTQSKNGDDFILELKVSKTKVFVGEPILLEFIFKYKIGSELSSVSLDEFKQNDFWIKKLPLSKPYVENSYISQKQPYLIFPQKDGNITIPSYQAIVAVSNFGFYKKRKIFSNQLQLFIKPLPNNIDLIGEFNIKANTDKIKANINEAINLTIQIDGIGNIDDIEEFKLNIDGVVIYSSKPVISTKIKNNLYSGSFIQKISFISDSNFTIPTFKISYFDKNKNKIVTKKTKPIKIEIFGKKNISHIELPNSKANIKKIDTCKKNYFEYLYLILGFIIGVLTTIMLFKKKSKKIKIETPMSKKIKKAKTDKELYEILLPYINNKEIKKIIPLLEENIYKNKNNKIDKKRLNDLFLKTNKKGEDFE